MQMSSFANIESVSVTLEERRNNVKGDCGSQLRPADGGWMLLVEAAV